MDTKDLQLIVHLSKSLHFTRTSQECHVSASSLTRTVQKRYDDTGILLEEILEHTLQQPRGRDAVRRINRMHGLYDISNDDMLYVLATFVVMPPRWISR